MGAETGARLLAPEALQALMRSLLPLATLVTPNLAEAAALVGRELRTEADMRCAARDIRASGPEYVLVKGGHLHGSEAVDLLYDGRQFHEFRSRRLQDKRPHGTGCTYAAAIATFMAQGLSVVDAVAAAKQLITEAIRNSLGLGRGRGPVDLYATVRRDWDRRQPAGPAPPPL
jgi:hydroxymethylpyrimidine/phosphomethylpyrimidine kinase